MSSGEVLEGDQAPRASELDQWLDAHPGWEVVPRELDQDEDDHEDDEATCDAPLPEPVAQPQAATSSEAAANADPAAATAAAPAQTGSLGYFIYFLSNLFYNLPYDEKCIYISC